MDGTLIGPAYTHHFDTRAGFNNNQAGLGYISPDGWLAGAYQNSLGKPSVYAGKQWEFPIAENVGPAQKLAAILMAGGITGYPRAAVMPAVIPGVQASLGEGHKVAAMWLPPVPGSTGKGGVTLQYRKDF